MRDGGLEVVDDYVFQRRILDNTRPVLVLFTSHNCPPCKMLAGRLPDLAREFGDGLDIVRCQIEASPRAMRAYQITQVPTLVLFDDGVPIATHVGLWSLPAIRSWVHASLRVEAEAPDPLEEAKKFAWQAFLRSLFRRLLRVIAKSKCMPTRVSADRTPRIFFL